MSRANLLILADAPTRFYDLLPRVDLVASPEVSERTYDLYSDWMLCVHELYESLSNKDVRFDALKLQQRSPLWQHAQVVVEQIAGQQDILRKYEILKEQMRSELGFSGQVAETALTPEDLRFRLGLLSQRHQSFE